MNEHVKTQPRGVRANATTNYERHPLAAIFPPMEGDDFEKLVADIKACGLREPITPYQGKILDGWNRYRACQNAKVEPQFVEFKGTDAEAKAFLISVNIHRRHLNPETRRTLLAELIKTDPSKSNRQIAEQAKVSHHTVGDVRNELEATEQLARLESTTGADGKKRTSKRKGKQTEAQAAAKAYYALQEKLIDALGNLKELSSFSHALEYAEKTKARLDETIKAMQQETQPLKKAS